MCTLQPEMSQAIQLRESSVVGLIPPLLPLTTFPDTLSSSNSSTPTVSPIGTATTLSPQSSLGTGMVDSSYFTSKAGEPTPNTQPCSLEGSILGLYESVMASAVQASTLNGPHLQPSSAWTSSEVYHPPMEADFPLRRRARSSFSTHRRAVQRSKSSSVLRSARAQRNSRTPSPIMIPSATMWQPGIASAPVSKAQTPHMPSSVLQRASFLDTDPATDGLKSPTKVLAYQARVRQQRSAMRSLIEELKSGLHYLVEGETNHAENEAFLNSLRQLLLPARGPEESASGRSEANSHTLEASFARSRTSSSAGSQLVDSYVLERESPTTSPLSYLNSLGIFEVDLQTDASVCLHAMQAQVQGVWPSHTLPGQLEDRSRSRQKNAYKQRLRSEELSGIDFLSNLAKIVLTFVQETAAQQRSSMELHALNVIKTAVWQHRPEWDLLLAAERRLGWGKTQRSKSGTASAGPTINASTPSSPGMHDFGVLVPFFFLSYPSASL
ncbi:unnamed protein product [Sympodiomycopsis kandeliae]